MRICKYYDAVGIVAGIVFSCDLSFFPLPMNIPNDNHAVVADDELCVCDESECESFSEYDSECESECESESECLPCHHADVAEEEEDDSAEESDTVCCALWGKSVHNFL